MIFDRLENHEIYAGMGFNFPAAFKFLLETDLASLPVGRIELDGERLYAMLQAYETRSPAQARWEAHRRYIDIQYVLSGRELMGFANLLGNQSGEYQPEKDFQPVAAIETRIGNTIEVKAGQFVIFFPEDAHKPGMFATGVPEAVKKVVLKLRI